jgi:hypothetical protein
LGKAFLGLFASIGLMVLALRLLEAEGEHVYSGKDTSYKFLGGLGLFFLFLAFLLFTICSVYLSRQLLPAYALLLGCLVLVAAAVTWKVVMFSGVGMDNWTMLLIVPPLICFFSGFLLAVVGTIRLLLTKIRKQPR